MKTIWIKKLSNDKIQAIVAEMGEDIKGFQVRDIIEGDVSMVKKIVKRNFPELSSWATHNSGRPIVRQATARSAFTLALKHA